MSYLSTLSMMQWIFVGILCFAATMVAMRYYWRAWWIDFWYGFPITIPGTSIGKLKLLKKNTEQVASRNSWEQGMSQPEVHLCRDYSTELPMAKSKYAFQQAKEYLRLSLQSDVSPMPPWAFIVLVVLTIAEAMGTGFVLAPWISSEISSAQIGYAGWVIAVAMAVLLLLLTHHAGESAKKKMAIKHALGNLDINGKPADLDSNDTITPDMQQDMDNGKSAEARFYRRVVKLKDRGSWAPTIGVVVMLSLVLAMVFAVRWEGIKKQNTLEVVQMEKSGAAGDTGADSGNPFASANDAPLPPDIAQSQAQARKAVAQEVGKADLAQGFSAAFMLAMIYVLTQVSGFWFSYKHSFVSDGKKAYGMTRGKPDYETYYATYVLPFETRADARLSDLRRHFSSVLPDYAKNPPTVTFAQFTLNKKSEDHQRQQQEAQLIATSSVGANTGDGLDYTTVAKAILARPANEREQATTEWIEENGKKHAAALTAALSKLQADAPPQGVDYEAVAESIVKRPSSDRLAAMNDWLDEHGKKHTEELVEAIKRVKDRLKNEPYSQAVLGQMLED